MFSRARRLFTKLISLFRGRRERRRKPKFQDHWCLDCQLKFYRQMESLIAERGLEWRNFDKAISTTEDGQNG